MNFFPFVVFAIWLAAIVGWIMNIVTVVSDFSAALTTEIILRIVGIPVFPLGAIMGYL